jgi:hypothetical protein
MNLPKIVYVNGNPFPAYNGEALSWSIGLYNTSEEEQAGFPRVRAVVAAMRMYRPEQLHKERRDLLLSTCDRMFGHNAKRLLAVINDELRRLAEVGDRVYYRGRFDNVVGGILAERAVSPLTGNPRYRVVDSWDEAADCDAGRWVEIEDVIGIHPPV